MGNILYCACGYLGSLCILIKRRTQMMDFDKVVAGGLIIFTLAYSWAHNWYLTNVDDLNFYMGWLIEIITSAIS